MNSLIPALQDCLENAGMSTGVSSPKNVEDSTPFVRVMRSGGGDDFEQLRDEPVIDFDVYANDYKTAETAAWRAREHLTGLLGKQRRGLRFRRAFCLSGPTPVPDANPDLTRLMVTFEFSVKAVATN